MNARAWRALASAALAAALFAPTANAATPTAPILHSVAAVIAGMQSQWQNLKSYQVPVTLSGSVRASFVSVPFTIKGTEYYRAPDQQALHLESAPAIAQQFQNTVTSMGTPQTWPLNYSMSLKGTQTHNKHLAYVLVGTPKNSGSTVKTVTMYVAAKTYAVETVVFAYQNGSALDLEFSHHGRSPYHLPTRIGVTAKFPSYGGSAQIAYGTYQTNISIPDSAFQQDVSFVSHRADGHFGRGQYALRHAAENEVGDSSAPMRPHNDRVRTDGRRR
jgi:hypothetical protein